MTRQRATDFLTHEEITDFVRPQDLRGWLSVVITWLSIAVCFALLALWPTPLMWVLAVVLMGGRHLSLVILMHEAAHCSLFQSRALNDWVGKWLAAAPAWNHVDLYRKHHLLHHTRTMQDDDPDRSLVENVPMPMRSFFRKVLRDLSGLTALKRAYGLLLMDLGFLRYTVASDVVWLHGPRRSVLQIVRTGFARLFPTVFTHVIIFGLLWLLQHAWLYGLWWISWATTYSLFLRLRALAEHGAAARSTNPFHNTRTVYASLVARLLVAPHHVNYHLEHHLLMTVPHFRLSKLHTELKARGALNDALVAVSYRDVLRAIVRSS